MIGKSEQTIIKDTFVIQSGAGGNGGVLFKEGPGPLEVDKIPRTAGFGKQGLSNNVPVLTKVITGKGGNPGSNGKACESGVNQCDYLKNWSGKPGSNRRPQPWQGCALPTELFPHTPK